MRGLVASTFFSVLLLAAPLRPGLPSQLVGQASAAEPDQLPPVESTQSPSAAQSSGAASVAKICDALAAAAGENNLPVDFFARLIWQESRFDPTAVSRAGAQGVAQVDQLVAQAMRQPMPAIYYAREFAAAGGLISYASSFADSFRQAATYVGRLLKGEKRPICQSCSRPNSSW